MSRDTHLEIVKLVLVVAPNRVVEVIIFANDPHSFVRIIPGNEVVFPICIR